jgi:protein-S-isoprenylcysteine O-methyltransferase Ste14
MTHTVRTAIFTFLVPGAVAGLFPYLLVHRHIRPAPPAFAWPGLVLLALGALCLVRCAFDFVVAGHGTPAPIDPPRTLVVRGPYRFVRNPMYVGVLSVLLGEAVTLASLTLLCYAILVALLFHWFVVLYEEPNLRARFGQPYADYSRRVPRWFPRFRL